MRTRAKSATTGTAAVAVAVLGLAVASTAAAEEAGKKIFDTTCVACHGKDGKGAIPGVPTLRGISGPLAKTDEELLRAILDGLKSPGTTLAMPPRGGNPKLTEDDARAVLRYLRTAFGQP